MGRILKDTQQVQKRIQKKILETIQNRKKHTNKFVSNFYIAIDQNTESYIIDTVYFLKY